MRLVVWDLDGTVLDSCRAISAVANRCLTELGHPERDPAVVHALIGLPLEDVLSACLPEGATADLPELQRRYVACYAEVSDPLTRAFDGVPELLADLAAAGVRNAVATGKRQAGLERVVARFGLTGRFDLLAGADRVSRPKPHPDLLLWVLEQLDVRPEQAVMVGDTTFDVEMGCRAGVQTIGVTWGAHAPELLVGAGAHAIVEDVAALRRRLLGEAGADPGRV